MSQKNSLLFDGGFYVNRVENRSDYIKYLHTFYIPCGRKADSRLKPGIILLPQDHDYYRFNGSLTTPPCPEGVWWLVMKYFQTASKEQIDKFAHTMHHPNNRPVQPANARAILK